MSAGPERTEGSNEIWVAIDNLRSWRLGIVSSAVGVALIVGLSYAAILGQVQANSIEIAEVKAADAANKAADAIAHGHIKDVETNKKEIKRNREGINYNGAVLRAIADELNVQTPPRPVVDD